MALRTIISHNSGNLKSFEIFHKLLPEFSEAPTALSSVVDKAFNKSIIQDITDVREWKSIRDEALQTQPRLTPRELARFKFSLCHRSPSLLTSYLGRPALHSWIDSKATEMIPHLSAIECLSMLTAFSSTTPPSFYSQLIFSLLNELSTEQDLNILSLAVYIVNNHYNHPVSPIPCVKDTKYQEFAVKVMKAVKGRVLERVTEFSDDQFAMIAAGIGRMGVGFESIEVVYDVLQALQEDFLNRRLGRMSVENLVDVAAGFFYTNWASDEVAKVLIDKLVEKRGELNYYTGLDCALAVSQRDPCPKELLGTINSLVKSQMHREDYVKISKFILNTECKDESLITQYVNTLQTYRSFPEVHYEQLKKFQYYLTKHFPKLLPLELGEKIYKSGYLFNASHYTKIYTETHTPEFSQFTNWLKSLNLSFIAPFIYNNHDIVHFGFMPQKVAIMLAMPKYDLCGRWEEDVRIIKEPRRRFKVANGFEIRCKWLELLGFKVLRMNYQEIAENAKSKEDRDSKMLGLLKGLGIEARATGVKK